MTFFKALHIETGRGNKLSLVEKNNSMMPLSSVTIMQWFPDLKEEKKREKEEKRRKIIRERAEWAQEKLGTLQDKAVSVVHTLQLSVTYNLRILTE